MPTARDLTFQEMISDIEPKFVYVVPAKQKAFPIRKPCPCPRCYAYTMLAIRGIEAKFGGFPTPN